MIKLKAVVQKNEILVWDEVPDLTPDRGEVLIQVKASAVNRADLAQRQGRYPPPQGVTEVMGLECSGIVAGTGSGVDRFKNGDRVCALLAGGGYSEYVTVAAGQVVPIPKNLSFEQAACLPEVFATAYLNLYLEAKTIPGETVLLHAGASGVGTAGIQLCHALQNRCFVTVGDRQKLAKCKELGASEGWIRTDSDFAEEVMKCTEGRGVDVILDPVGGSYLEHNLRCLATDGRLVLIGVMGGTEANLQIRQLMVKRQRIIGSTLRARSIASKSQVMDELSSRIWPYVERGEIVPIIHRVYPIQQVDEAHQEVASNKTIGKVVLLVG